MTDENAAKSLYLNGCGLDRISEILSIKYNTISKWSSNGKWKKAKLSQAFREDTNNERIWKLIDHQLQILERVAEIENDAISEITDVKELKEHLISRGDIDAFTKLYSTTKGKEIAFDGIVRIAREIIEFVNENGSNKLAKEIGPFVDDYLNNKRKDL